MAQCHPESKVCTQELDSSTLLQVQVRSRSNSEEIRVGDEKDPGPGESDVSLLQKGEAEEENEGNGEEEVEAADNRCGFDVNVGDHDDVCERFGYSHIGNDKTQHCYSYGGPGDPCALHDNNDPNHGLDKDPGNCRGDTFYLWDEPVETNKRRSMEVVVSQWKQYVHKFHASFDKLRKRGVMVTTPMFKAGGEFHKRFNQWFQLCPECKDPKSSYFTGVIAINLFCNSSPNNCAGGAQWSVGMFRKIDAVANAPKLPVYITNWAMLGGDATSDRQKDAMAAATHFFGGTSPVARVYWFGATDYGGGAQDRCLLSTRTSDGKTLGDFWKKTCDAINAKFPGRSSNKKKASSGPPSPAPPAPPTPPSHDDRSAHEFIDGEAGKRMCTLHGWDHYSCASRAKWLHNVKGMDLVSAVNQVKSECKAQCEVVGGGGDHAAENRAAENFVNGAAGKKMCTVYGGTYSCASRVKWLENVKGMNLVSAVRKVKDECKEQC